jgi:hypothetical protein
LGLFYQLYFNNIGHEEVCIFLRDLLRHLRGPVIAILDNSTTHRVEPLAELQRQLRKSPAKLRGCILQSELSSFLR